MNCSLSMLIICLLSSWYVEEGAARRKKNVSTGFGCERFLKREKNSVFITHSCRNFDCMIENGSIGKLLLWDYVYIFLFTTAGRHLVRKKHRKTLGYIKRYCNALWDSFDRYDRHDRWKWFPYDRYDRYDRWAPIAAIAEQSGFHMIATIAGHVFRRS